MRRVSNPRDLGEEFVVDKTNGKGIRVDKSAPTFAWFDLIGTPLPRTTGPGTPTLAAFRGGNARQFCFAAGEDLDADFHIPHDYAPGTDVYLHFHWGHNGTAISGSLVIDTHHTYTKGHNQAIFPAEKTVQLTVSTPDIATIPQYSHRIDEVQLSSNGGSATLIDSALLEPDGLIILHYDVSTIPTITGGSPNKPFLHHVDLHYQTTSVGTKQKEPDFYV